MDENHKSVETYTNYAAREGIRRPFPVGKDDLIRYIKYKQTKMKLFSSLYSATHGLMCHPLHGKSWETNVFHHADVVKLMESLRGGMPKEVNAEKQINEDDYSRCQAVQGPKSKGFMVPSSSDGKSPKPRLGRSMSSPSEDWFLPTIRAKEPTAAVHIPAPPAQHTTTRIPNIAPRSIKKTPRRPSIKIPERKISILIPLSN